MPTIFSVLKNLKHGAYVTFEPTVNKFIAASVESKEFVAWNPKERVKLANHFIGTQDPSGSLNLNPLGGVAKPGG